MTMLIINGFTPISPCLPRRYWRHLGCYLDYVAPRARWIEQQTTQRWERNYPENAEYAKTRFFGAECEVGMVEGFRFITEDLSKSFTEHVAAVQDEIAEVFIIHPSLLRSKGLL